MHLIASISEMTTQTLERTSLQPLDYRRRQKVFDVVGACHGGLDYGTTPKGKNRINKSNGHDQVAFLTITDRQY